MLAIDNKLISDEVVLEHFVCDLSKCKGGCCEDGDAGAPLTDEELDDVLESYDAAKPYMTPAGIAVVEKVGKYVYCLLYTSPSPRDRTRSRMPSSA